MKNINSKTREVLKKIPAVDRIILDCYKRNDITFHYSIIKKLVKQEIKTIKSEIINGCIEKDIKENIYN